MSIGPNQNERRDERKADDGEELQFSEKSRRSDSRPQAREIARPMMRKHRRAFAELAK